MCHLNVIFDWKWSQLIIGGIIVEKLRNSLWGIFSYLYTSIPTPNEQPFLQFSILTPYFCSYLSLIIFSYILLYCYCSDVAIFDNVMKFEFNLICKVITSRYWFTTLYSLCSYIKKSPYISLLYCYIL